MTDPPSPIDADALVDEQIAYYRARAPEYDEWWLREGAHDRGPAFADAWEEEGRVLHHELARFDARGHVLELAAGTGNLTLEIARTAEHITAVDASPEALEIARRKLAGGPCPVDFVVADLFEWRPGRRYDVVCFSFWLSHVPEARFDEFWSLVADALRPGGRVFFVDSAREGDDSGTPADGRTIRSLNDGSAYTIVKRYWDPPELASDLGELGWDADVRTTPGGLFLLGSGRRAD